MENLGNIQVLDPSIGTGSWGAALATTISTGKLCNSRALGLSTGSLI
jgi:hypothetical protein